MAEDRRPIVWRKSSASGTGNCVEVASAGQSILVRDTKNRADGVLTFTATEWQAFVAGVQAGEFSLAELQGS